jgi:hypothetical protein
LNHIFLPTMISYAIKGGVHTYSFLSNLFATMPGPDKDPLKTLHSQTGLSQITSFVTCHYQMAKSSDRPEFSLKSRFPVKGGGIIKAGFSVQHESFAVWAYDRVTRTPLEFVIERVPSDHTYASRFSVFSDFPDSQQVLESLQKAIHNMRSMPAQAAESLFAAIKTETEAIPLLPLYSPESETEAPESSSSPPTSSVSADIPQMSLKDTVTSSLARAVAVARNASRSVSPQSLAHDTISGRSPGTLIPENCILRFNPVEMSLFDVVLLAQLVHQYAPIYGLFDNHCYMFACVVFDAMVQLFSLPASAHDPDRASTSISTPVPAPTPGVNSAPNNANIVVVPSPGPDRAGRWSGLLILDPIVKATIVSIVVARFRAERRLYVV